MSDMRFGPNAKKLLAHFIAIEAVPVGGGLASGLNFLADENLRRKGISRAIANLHNAIELIKSAPDNPHGDDDEAIAGAILQHIKETEVDHD